MVTSVAVELIKNLTVEADVESVGKLWNDPIPVLPETMT